jgi:hypothetical protein
MMAHPAEVDPANDNPASVFGTVFRYLLSALTKLFALLGFGEGTVHRARLPMPRQRAYQHFKYTSLRGPSEFRLLELMPGEKNSPIVCELRHHNLLHDPPSYEALSYVWGPVQASETISCNCKAIKITGSLKTALCRVRQSKEKIHVWADAICINQLDLMERKSQVDLMRRIFAKAKQVSICLGQELDCSVEDLSTLHTIFRSPVSTRTRTNLTKCGVQPKRSLVHPLRSSYQRQGTKQRSQSKQLLLEAIQDGTASRKVPLETPTNSILHSLTIPPLAPVFAEFFNTPSWILVAAKFFDNPWFRRIWVIQEVAESRKARVLCDDLEVPWQNIVNVAVIILQNSGLRVTFEKIARTNGIRNVLFMNNEITVASHDPIPILLQSTRNFEATDPRDKVYAMLHRPVRKSRTYIDVKFRPYQQYVEFFAQSVSLLYFLSIAWNHEYTDIHFWYLIISCGTLLYHLRLHLTITSLAVDYFLRIINFINKLDRIVYSRFQPTDTLFNMLDMRADYSLTAPSVYRMVATRTIARTRKLNILSYVQHGDVIDATYPSWVPRWDRPTGGMDILSALPNHKFRASGNLQHSLPLSTKHADHLVVEGIRYSEIVLVTEARTSTTQYQQLHSNSPALATDGHQANEHYFTDESLRRACVTVDTIDRLGLLRIGQLFKTSSGATGIGPRALQ